MKTLFESDIVNALAHKEWIEGLIVLLTNGPEAEAAPGGGFLTVPKPDVEADLAERDLARTRVAVALGLVPAVAFHSEPETTADRLALALRARFYPEETVEDTEPAQKKKGKGKAKEHKA